MSRCRACDVNLSDFESTRKIVRSDKSIDYPDLCNTCFSSSNLNVVSQVVERYDLQESSFEEVVEEIDYE